MRQPRHISQPSDLAPGIKSWVDNCLIPILVKDYFSGAQKILATEAHSVAHSAGEMTSQPEVNR